MPTPSPSGGILHSPAGAGATAANISTSQGSSWHGSRVLPQRSWAGAIPTLLTHEGFETMCTPCIHPDNTTVENIEQPLFHSPLERFLGAVYVKKHLQKTLLLDKDLVCTFTQVYPSFLIKIVSTRIIGA